MTQKIVTKDHSKKSIEEFNLGQNLGPAQGIPSDTAPKEQVQQRLAKEEIIHTHGIPPAYPGMMTKFVKHFPPKKWLPQTLFAVSKYAGAKAQKNVTDFQLCHKTIKINNLPKELKGLKLLHISDLHLDLIPSFAQSVARFLAKHQNTLSKAHLALITGDTQEKYAEPVTKTVEGFKLIAPHIPCPILASLGNHDSLKLADEVSKIPHHAGIRFLVNQQIKFRAPNGRKLVIQGIDDPYYYKSYKLEHKNGEDLNILLAHSPQILEEANHHRVDLCLSGHTHGGQIKIPALGALVNRAGVKKEYIEGAWKYKNLKGYTSRGVGCSSVPVRINCPPEITIIELQ